MVNYLNKHPHVLQTILGMIGTAVCVVVYFYTTFVTKVELEHQYSGYREFENFRLERLENKIDKLDDKLSELGKRRNF